MKVLLIASLLFAFVASQGLLVHTQEGDVLGKEVALPLNKSRIAHAWLGIPYAESTAGSLRFTDPVAKKPWQGTFSATEFGAGCPQQCVLPPHTCPQTQSEDCLSLNVYAPAVAFSNAPVMVFFPGGRFEQGASDTYLYDGRFLVQEDNMIVVTVNYRLGALGFLYTKDQSATGNYGMRDQRLALQWVQRNIAAFGGDPTRVTIDGQSAGGSSVTYHVLASQSAGLFHRAIIQSNPASLPLKEAHDGEELAKHFSKELGCGETDLACIRSKPVEELLQAQNASQHKFNPLRPLDVFLPWTPMVGTGGDALPAQPLKMFLDGEITNNVPLMTGVVANESLIFVYQGLGAEPSEALYLAFLVDVFGIHSARVLEKYPPHMGGTILHTLSLLGTDYIMACPARVVANSAAKKGNSGWLYYFDHIMSFSKVAWGPGYPECYDECCHGSELVWLYGSASLAIDTPVTSGELNLTRAVQSSWINFIEGKAPQDAWKPYDATTAASWLFSTPESERHQASGPFAFPRGEFCDFFDDIGYGASTRFVENLHKMKVSPVRIH